LPGSKNGNWASSAGGGHAARRQSTERGTRMTKKSRRLIPDAQVCARYDIHTTTLRNWDLNPDLNFPKPVRINGRKYRALSELDRFDQARAAERNENAA